MQALVAESDCLSCESTQPAVRDTAILAAVQKLLHYEIAHMTKDEHSSLTGRLKSLGYSVMSTESATDEMAFRL